MALRVLEGAEVIDRGDYLVVRSLDNPGFWWGNFLLLGAMPEGGAEAIASRGEAAEEEEMLDRAAMESGTD